MVQGKDGCIKEWLMDYFTTELISHIECIGPWGSALPECFSYLLLIWCQKEFCFKDITILNTTTCVQIYTKERNII